MNKSPHCTKPPLIARVAIPSPLRRLFDYLVPDSNGDAIPSVGARVVVPFGKQTLVGIITELSSNSDLPLEKLKPVSQVLDLEALFPETLRELLSWASNYYQYPLGLLYDSALPAWLRKQKAIELANIKAKTQITITGLELNPQQQAAVDQVQASWGKFKTFLLDGVTGSGKTEVYMQLIAAALEQGKQALILIPEINLTPQTLENFQARFNVPIAVLNSQISEKKRATAWLQAKNGTAPIVLGTRLAAFTPLKQPGLFIIDEEHDPSFKQQDHFRYSARDLLLKRAQLEQSPIVLGTATPSLETWHNVATERYAYLSLPDRAGEAQKPDIQIIDIRHNKLDHGLSNQLLAEIKNHLDNKGQVLLFLNRRGYAPVLMCMKCGWHKTCQRCDSNMILHYQTQDLRCHHCDAHASIPKACPNCADPTINGIGLGTQRIEACLNAHFPNANIARIDRDTANTKTKLQTMFDAVHAGTTDILIGTQMLAKGHHFPNLSLVAIVDIDSALFSVDFRATERMGQLITQVAGRAGRGTKLGKVLLQTTHPENPLLMTLIYHNYHSFLKLLMQERKDARLPPFTYQVLLRAENKKPSAAINFLTSIKKMIFDAQQDISCLGPSPAPMEKRQGYFRAHLLLQANSRKILQILLQQITPQIEAHPLARSLRWSIDVDPIDMY